jgi:zinc transporter, ZIP family
MREAALFGSIASSALVAGSVIGAVLEIHKRVLAFLLAFASGALITAMAFELYHGAVSRSDAVRAGIAFVGGAVVFIGIDTWLDRRVAATTPTRTTPKLESGTAAIGEPTPASSTGGLAGFALLAAVTLDGVPENLALGISLGEGHGSLALLLAIFASNLPESLVGSAQMCASGRSRAFAIGTWTIAAALLAASCALGFVAFGDATDETISVPLAFAGGAVIASLADTLMPEAYHDGGPMVALATVAGFLLSYILAPI